MKYRICVITTVSASIKAFYKGQLEEFNKAGFETTVICGKDEKLKDFLPEETNYIPVNFSRKISILQDLKSLFVLYKIFKKNKYDIVQYSTPKASLIAAIASFFARMPIRIYILWGLYYMRQKGFKRKLFKYFEKIISKISHIILPIAHEMVGFAIDENLGKKEKYKVMLNGSACGVDLETFNPEKWKPFRNKIRNELHVLEDGVVIGTVARLTGDKGINELVQAFNEISNEIPKAYLLLVGDQEEKDRLLPATERIINMNPRIRSVGWQDDPLPYYSTMDIFCLPTYREGFGEVNLEAQAMGLPVVSTDVIGPRESVENNSTGYLIESQKSEALLEPLRQLLTNQELRTKFGIAGRKRVIEKFDRKEMIKAIIEHRLSLLEKSKQNDN